MLQRIGKKKQGLKIETLEKAGLDVMRFISLLQQGVCRIHRKEKGHQDKLKIQNIIRIFLGPPFQFRLPKALYLKGISSEPKNNNTDQNQGCEDFEGRYQDIVHRTHIGRK